LGDDALGDDALGDDAFGDGALGDDALGDDALGDDAFLGDTEGLSLFVLFLQRPVLLLHFLPIALQFVLHSFTTFDISFLYTVFIIFYFLHIIMIL
jgi:hypothetical protein